MALSVSNQDARIAALLTDYVDGVAPLDALLQKHSVSYQQISDLVSLADKLGNVLVEVAPSPEFVNGLYAELVQASSNVNRAWWNRVAVPRRVQDMSNRTILAYGIGGLTLAYLTARSLSFLLHQRQDDDVTLQELIA